MKMPVKEGFGDTDYTAIIEYIKKINEVQIKSNLQITSVVNVSYYSHKS